MKCLRATALALCIAACPISPAFAQTRAAEREVVYVDADSGSVRQFVPRIESELRRSGAMSRHAVRVTLAPVADMGEASSIEAALRPVIARRPAVIVASNGNIATVAQSLTAEVPIVFVTYGDPIATRLVGSLARPGGNLTGFTFFVPLHEKRLELLATLAPKLRRVGVIVDRWWLDELGGRSARDVAKAKLGLDMIIFRAESPEELRRALTSPEASSVDAWYVPLTRLAYEQPAQVLEQLRATHRPAVYAATRFVEGGGLISYQPRLTTDQLIERIATMATLVLDGVPPADIPVERPRAFELAVNAHAARELGLRLPDALLKRADRVVR